MSLAAALTSLVYDGIRSIVGQTVYISSVNSTWENIPHSWLAALPPTVERLADAWHGVIQPYFPKRPVWLVLAVIGGILIWAKEKPLIERARE